MTEEAKHVIEVIDMLNKCNDTPCFKCKKLEFNGLAACEDEESFYRHVASVIESLSEQLEQVTKERDAAVRDIEKSPITLCDVCAHYHKNFPCSGGNGTDKINLTIACTMFKWRGVEVEQ